MSKPKKREDAQTRNKAFYDEVDQINERLNQIAANDYVDPDLTDDFNSLPILTSTKNILVKNNFVTMSPIQKQTLLFTLCGCDLVGQALTGTGKTLAFLIPMIETLKKNFWSRHSGLGGIIIAPTRDLADQTYKVLKLLLDGESIVAGLLTGGLHFEAEQMNLSRLNIAVCTLGRLKEHVDNSPMFNTDNLKMLILDEADLLLGPDFLKDIKDVVASFPKERQTIMFTATVAKSLKQLTKITLRDPKKVYLDTLRESATPENLMQFYINVPFGEKFNYLFSFLHTHRSDKIIVFMETVKLVRFTFEAFRHLRPGIPILHLTGKQSTEQRFATCKDFASQNRAVIFTTDVAARGLDFPSVNWVIQVDCPFTTETYIHRVGRTARFFTNGKSLLFLYPSELGFVQRLAAAKVEVKSTFIGPTDLLDIKPRLVDTLAKFTDIKQLAIRGFITYFKSVQRHNDGEVFKVEELLAAKDEFAASFGLLSVPLFVKKQAAAIETPDSDSNESPEEPFFTVVDEGDYHEPATPMPGPETMEFLNPDAEIPDEEYQAWRLHLRQLLEGQATSTKKTPPHEDGSRQQQEASLDIEQEALKKLMATFENE